MVLESANGFREESSSGERFRLFKLLLLLRFGTKPDPGNEELLDEFISYHVVDESMEYKQFSDGVNWTVHAGPTLSLTNKGGIHFGGAHVRSGSIETDLGTIIGMDDLIYFPEFEK